MPLKKYKPITPVLRFRQSASFEELTKVEMLDERDQAREKAEENAREQAELDRIAAMRFNAGGAHA